MCYSEEIKAAVRAALLQGESINQVAAKYNIPRGTISSWRSRDQIEPLQISASAKRDIGDLLVELLRTQIESAINRTRLFGDADWLREQSDTHGLAILHGVDADKMLRLVEAYTGQPDSEPEVPAVPIFAPPTGGGGEV